MPNVNNCTLMGHAGSDAETRQTKNGKNIVNISLAITSGWGEYKQTVWTKLRVVGAPTDWMAETRKGDVVMVSGAEYCIDEWQDKNGDDKRSHYFLAGKGSSVTVLPKVGRVPAQERGDGTEPQKAEFAPPEQEQDVQGADDDNVPF